jgi:hypothetical protein
VAGIAAVARGWGEREDGDGGRDLGNSILGEIGFPEMG